MYVSITPPEWYRKVIFGVLAHGPCFFNWCLCVRARAGTWLTLAIDLGGVGFGCVCVRARTGGLTTLKTMGLKQPPKLGGVSANFGARPPALSWALDLGNLIKPM